VGSGKALRSRAAAGMSSTTRSGPVKLNSLKSADRERRSSIRVAAPCSTICTACTWRRAAALALETPISRLAMVPTRQLIQLRFTPCLPDSCGHGRLYVITPVSGTIFLF
jgi:hypothetical protein